MHVSRETYLFMRREIERLQRENDALSVEVDHWYMRANYTHEEIAEFRRRASLGLDENGNWIWPNSLTSNDQNTEHSRSGKTFRPG